VRASPLGKLAQRSGAELDRVGRLKVSAGLTLPGHPEVFAIGDMISVPNVPGTAQPAIQEGKYVARVIRGRIAGHEKAKPFRYRNLGMAAVIGRADAVADLFGRIRIGGALAFLIWGVVHLVYLVGWANRFGAVSRWLRTVLARNWRERLISVTSLVSEETARGVAFAAARGERPGDPDEPAESSWPAPAVTTAAPAGRRSNLSG
jgi:NADH:quinone reductase (non-electrogenic)